MFRKIDSPAILTGTFFLLPFFAMYAAKAIPLLHGIVTILMAITYWQKHGRLPAPPKTYTIIAIVFCLWATASLAWTPDTLEAARKLFSIILIIISFGIILGIINSFTDADIYKLGKYALYGSLIVTIITYIDYFNGSYFLASIHNIVDIIEMPGHGYLTNRGFSFILPLLFFLFIVLNSFLLKIFILFLLFATLDSFSETVKVSFFFSALLLIVVYFIKVRLYSIYLLSFLIISSFLIMPSTIDRLPNALDIIQEYPFVPSSAVHRVIIWKNTTAKIDEKPLRGWGIDSSRTFYSAEDAVRNIPYFDSNGNLQFFNSEPIPLHPHNAILQWRLELGIPGILILSGSLLATLVWLSKTARNDKSYSFIVGGFGSWVMITGLAFGAWQTWWICASGFLMIFLTMAARYKSGYRS